MIKIILIVLVFLLGLYFVMFQSKISLEGYKNKEKETNKCPNMLIERDNNYFLYNSSLAVVPGVNPIQFKTLEEYTEFVEWQRGQGINCPVLQLQYSTDPQNNEVYKIKPNIFENQGGLPNQGSEYGLMLNENSPQGLYSNDRSELFDANQDDPPYNQGGPPGFDGENQYIGLKTPIDNIGSQETKYADAMNSNWKGTAYTQNLINTGQFSTDEVSKTGSSILEFPERA